VSRRLLFGLTAAALVIVLGLIIRFVLSAPEEADDGGSRKPPAPRELRLRILTGNIWGIPLGLSQDFETRMERLERHISRLKPDIVSLQEVWAPGLAGRLTRNLGERYHSTFATTGVLGGRLGRPPGGLLVLSRHRIVSSRFIPYPEEQTVKFRERMAGKGILEVELETPSGRIIVVATHLILPFHGGAQGGEIHARQLDLLHEVLAGVPAERPVVLAGDLNTASTWGEGLTPEYRRFLDAGLVDTLPPERRDGELIRPPGTYAGWPHNDETALNRWKPDYIFVRPGEGREVVVVEADVVFARESAAVSDHNAVWAVVRVRRKQAGAER